MKRLLLPALCSALLASPAPAQIDTNSNSLADEWEKAWNNNSLFPPAFNPQADPDGDGWKNLVEALAGTNPFNSQPPTGIIFPEISATPATYEPLPPGETPPPPSVPPQDPFAPGGSSPPGGPAAVLLDPPVVTLTWPTIPGKTYRAHVSENLSTWLPASETFLGSGIHQSYETEPLNSDGTIPAKLFWRVETGDTDSDGDTLTDYEEIRRGLNPFSKDSDGDGIPDNTDPAPLVNSLQPAWDADSTDPAGGNLFASFNFTPNGGATGHVPDISGNTRHGTARVATTPTFHLPSATPPNAEGIAGSGLHCADTRHLAFAVRNPGINFQPVRSLSFWLKTKAADLEGVGQPIFCYASQFALYNQIGNASNPDAIRAYLRKQASGTGYEIVWYDWQNPGAVIRERWILALTKDQLDGNWINLTFVWQGGGGLSQSSHWACYANGTRQTRTQFYFTRFQSTSAFPGTPQDTFLIGAVAAGPNAANNNASVTATFKGSLDRVRLYTSALTPAQVTSIVSQDADNDGLWDSTEMSSSTWKDTNSNGRRDPGEIHYPNGNPLFWQPANTDTDSDGLTDIFEQNTTRTIFHNHDTDGDLLPDGWEHRNGLDPLSAAGIHGTTGNPDGDGADNFDEWRFLSNPNSAHSDTDGVPDGVEIGQGSHPADPTDNGQAPPPAEKLTLRILVGDPSGSHSERWRIEAEEVATGRTVLRHASRNYGEMSTPAASTFSQFKPGKAYRFKLRHAGTDPALLKTDPEGVTYPDYDWSLQISYKDAAGNFISLASPAQTEYLVIDPYNDATKTRSPDPPLLLAPEFPWGSIGQGTAARYDYRERVEAMSVIMLPLSITPDTNRDGKIDLTDRGKNDSERPWHFWLNDDDDSGATGGTDIPQGPETAGINAANYAVDGERDLVDFFPLDLGLSDVLKVLPESKYTYRLLHPNTKNDPALKIVQAGDLSAGDSDDYLRTKETAVSVTGISSLPVHNSGRPLDARFINKLREGTGLLLVEALRPSNRPVKLEIKRKGEGGAVVAEIPFHIRFAPVENLYRHLNLRDETGGSGGQPDQPTPPSYPDELCNEDWLVTLHGYNVNGEEARGWHAEGFKRFFWSGNRTKFVGVSWHGDETKIFGQGTPKYYENVENGFNTAPLLAQYLNGLQGGRKFLFSHSLGGLVVADAMANHGAVVEKAFLLNAAMPTESLLPKAFVSNDPHMEPGPWRAYPEAIKSSEWYKLFSAADARSKLTWRGIFHSAVPKMKIFYSPGEEVLTAFPLDLEADPGIAVEDPVGKYAFALQAMLKGMLGSEPDTVQSTAKAKFISLLTHVFSGLSPASDTAGWAINASPDGGSEAYNTQVPNTTNYAYRPPTWFDARVQLPAFRERLRTDPAFRPALPDGCSGLYDPSQGSQIAGTQWKFNRMIGQMIPERSLPAGGAGGSGVAGEALSLATKTALSGGSIATYDMQANRNGWPANRPLQFGNGWRHGDIRSVSYLYVWKTWNQIVEDGNLSHE